MNRTPAKHAALQRIAAGGDGLGLLQSGWPDNTLDELCKAGMFTWVTGRCELTVLGAQRLAAWDLEAGGSSGTQAAGTPARERSGRQSGASQRRHRETAREDAPYGG